MSVVSFVATVSAAATPQEMYVAAMAREQTVRAALAEDDAPASVAADVRAVVAAYQEIVRVYPTSGYSDNALWQAGRLSIDAFLRFGQERDKNTGIRLLRLLTTALPTSRFAKEVPEQLARVDTPARAVRRQPACRDPRDRPSSPQSPRSRTSAAKCSPTPSASRSSSTAKCAFHDERIPDPVRVFVDLPSTRAAPALVDKTLRFDGDNDIVRQIRIGRHPNATTRVCSMPRASRATACTRCTIRTGWSSIASERPASDSSSRSAIRSTGPPPHGSRLCRRRPPPPA